MIVTLQTFKRKKMGSNGFIFEYLITITKKYTLEVSNEHGKIYLPSLWTQDTECLCA